MGKEKVKTRSSAEDFRKGQDKSRGSREHEDQALMREREFSGQQ